MIELPPGPFGTIVADPPWTYRQTRIVTTAKTKETSPEVRNRYGTMTIDEVAAMPVESITAKDAHLYLWITNPKLFGERDAKGSGRGPMPIDIIEAWGFRYVTMLTWHKRGTMGLGYYFRGDTEHVLFAVRGKAPIPPADRVRNIFEARKVGHSIKPDRLQEIAEKVSPGPRLELFARRARPGWTTWGDEAPEASGLTGPELLA